MSLIKQLWIGIAILMLIAFGGSLLVSSLTGVHYLQQQIQLKNIDNVTALALSLSQMEKDPVRVELLISAQFDAGHYEWIRLTTPEGEVLVERTQRQGLEFSAPGWFHRLMPLKTEPATALIQDGWQQYGVLSLSSHTGYAIDNLWEGTVRLLMWFLAVSVAAGLFGTLFLRTVARPLDAVVSQAEAIGERRFVFSDEPRTQEFRRLVRSMNLLSTRVRSMLERETQQLEKMRQQLQHDELTGLPNRAFFLAKLDQFIGSEDSEQAGALIFIRVLGLQLINAQLGHKEANSLLENIAEAIGLNVRSYEGSFAGRLNGSDFALLIPQRHMDEKIVQNIRVQLNRLVATLESDITLSLPVAVCKFMPKVTRAALLAATDGALASAEMNGNQSYVITSAGQAEHSRTELEEWRTVLSEAIEQQEVSLGHFPVKTIAGDSFQVECPVRIRLDGHQRQAGYFLPWISRLGLLPELDLKVVEKALSELAEVKTINVAAINISTETLMDPTARRDLLATIRHHDTMSGHLALEFGQSTVIRYPEAFSTLCSDLKELGCQVGIKHVGDDFSRISQLHGLGLDYIKVDGALSRNIKNSKEQQAFVRGLCTLGHSLGIMMIAVNVTSLEEYDTLADLGLDAMTGPLLTETS